MKREFDHHQRLRTDANRSIQRAKDQRKRVEKRISCPDDLICTRARHHRRGGCKPGGANGSCVGVLLQPVKPLVLDLGVWPGWLPSGITLLLALVGTALDNLDDYLACNGHPLVRPSIGQTLCYLGVQFETRNRNGLYEEKIATELITKFDRQPLTLANFRCDNSAVGCLLSELAPIQASIVQRERDAADVIVEIVGLTPTSSSDG